MRSRHSPSGGRRRAPPGRSAPPPTSASTAPTRCVQALSFSVVHRAALSFAESRPAARRLTAGRMPPRAEKHHQPMPTCRHPKLRTADSTPCFSGRVRAPLVREPPRSRTNKGEDTNPAASRTPRERFARPIVVGAGGRFRRSVLPREAGFRPAACRRCLARCLPSIPGEVRIRFRGPWRHSVARPTGRPESRGDTVRHAHCASRGIHERQFLVAVLDHPGLEITLRATVYW